ncbi:MAG: hypothetical protein FWE95_11785 [Planctomycetaceae bacterium]|nr:hypothetical protein [Planctomycetaceae bacterium]
MSQNSSHQSDMMPPLSPVAKGLVLAFSVFMTLVLVAFIGFLAVEFVAEMTGHPIRFFASDPMEGDGLPTAHDLGSELKDPFELITPGHQTQIRGPEVVVIYTERIKGTATPDLRINGIQHSWEKQYGNNTWFARLWLPTGLHQLRAGEAEADFFVVAPGSTQFSPEPWLVIRPHLETNETDRCVQCHEMSEAPFFTPSPSRDVAIGAWRGATGCFVCHDEDEHAIAHRSVAPLIDRSLRCVRCHAIH